MFFPGCLHYNDHVITVASNAAISYDFMSGTIQSRCTLIFPTSEASIDCCPWRNDVSTFPEDKLRMLTGTSMATALVSGIIHCAEWEPTNAHRRA